MLIAAQPVSSTPASSVIVELSIAFQPMLHGERIFAFRAEVTGPGGRAFEAVLGALAPEKRHALDCRRAALALRQAIAAGIVQSDALLLLPVNAASATPEALIADLLAAARDSGFPADRLVLEISADERGNLAPATRFAELCAEAGISIALSSFASGPVGLNLLAKFAPRFVTLDRSLVRNIDRSESLRLIVDGALRLARRRGVVMVAPLTETRGELAALLRIGVEHLQGGWINVEPAQRRIAPRREPRTLPLGTQRDLLTHRRQPNLAQDAIAALRSVLA
ncbi:EAL domain-containing protein [Sphingomonas sp. AOB5]|uniref:EAL domain-containing protein n=1 Tax=Sphingomonas sp. AOB5 TaxID=3034017 RepID=UPI0023F73F3A|nr:EAL domain-containing protein [Sphingomonas sp. AOB5]MDF7773812.1 EAL domain-containing protein [Sphingomonas sp. AOB5]